MSTDVGVQVSSLAPIRRKQFCLRRIIILLKNDRPFPNDTADQRTGSETGIRVRSPRLASSVSPDRPHSADPSEFRPCPFVGTVRSPYIAARPADQFRFRG